MKAINLKRFPYFNKDRPLRELNHLAEIHDNLMPHQVAAATGCSLDEAMGVLLLLVDRALVEAFLLVYHNAHPDIPVLARSMLEGFPTPPLTCKICEKDIEQGTELSYDFLFKKTDDITFVVESNELH
jgi:hypothetical protein